MTRKGYQDFYANWCTCVTKGLSINWIKFKYAND